MRKFLFTVLLTLLMVLPISASENFYVTVIINEQKYNFSEPIVNKDGRILVPMRTYFETLGASVDWQEGTRTVSSTYENQAIDITIDSNRPRVNGVEFQIDVPAQIIGNRTYVPLRFVGESLGYQVIWEGEARRVVINKLDTGELEINYLQEVSEEEENRGSSYTVVSTSVGEASWYGNEFHGRRTASGEVFDQHAYTAAHPNLPFGTYLKVTFLASDKSAIVRVNDRGPNQTIHPNRIIDLSRGAAEAIGLRPHGLGDVRVEVLAGAVAKN